MTTYAASGGDRGQFDPEIVTALQHDRRREIVERLHEQDEGISLVRLADQLSAVSDKPLPVVVTQLHDLDIPKLTSCGLLEYDSEMGVVTLVAETEVVETALEHVRPDK